MNSANYTTVKYPAMRVEALDALTSLADPARQQRYWVRKEDPGTDFHGNLSAVIAGLEHDSMVMPEPSKALGTVLKSEDEVAALEDLTQALDPLINRLGHRPDVDYMTDPVWPTIVERASVALAVMLGNE